MERIMRRASFLETLKAVLSGAIGVRKRADAEKTRLNPLHLIIAAVLFVALFVFAIRTIVRIVVS